MKSSRAFFVLWGAQAVGSLGAEAAGFALSLTVFSMTGNTLYLSLITALSTFAQIFLAPLAGGLSDYVSAKVAAVAANQPAPQAADPIGKPARKRVLVSRADAWATDTRIKRARTIREQGCSLSRADAWAADYSGPVGLR